MLKRFLKEKAPVTKIAKEFGISRKTFYKFKHRLAPHGAAHRFEVEGVAGLEDRSRAPHQRPRKIPPSVEEAIVEFRSQHPDFGPVRLQGELRNLGIDPPSESMLKLVEIVKTLHIIR